MNPVPIYHITHVSNLESIIHLKGLICDAEMKRTGVECREIAYQSIKERRAKKVVNFHGASPTATPWKRRPFFSTTPTI